MTKGKETPTTRKRRTREHVTEDLSLHHVTGLVLRAKYAVDRVLSDYGLDLWMQTFNERGEVEQEAIWLQVKAAEDLSRYALKGHPFFSYPVEVKDVRLWQSQLFPVYLILYDAMIQEAYWLNTETVSIDNTRRNAKHIRLRVPFANILGVRSLMTMRDQKNSLWQTYKNETERRQ